MKQQVDRLIANTLLDEGEVYLPSVGTLILCRHAAKLLSKKQLQTPFHELRLTKEQRGESLAFHISKVANVSAERAEDIYTEWLEQSLRNNILTIQGVCCIENTNIVTDKTFDDMANPNKGGTIRINPRTNYFIYIMAGLCIGFAIGIAGYVLYTNEAFDKLLTKEQVAPASEAFESVEQEATPLVAENIVVEEQPATEAVVIKEVATKSSIQPLQKGKSYAVWGVYNELNNAEYAINWLATRIPEIEGVAIYDYDGRYMVALCEVSSRSECGRKVSAWKAEHKSCKSVWVYTR